MVFSRSIRQLSAFVKPVRRSTLLIGALSSLLILLVWTGGFLNALRLRLGDLYFVGSHTAQNIAIVALDDASLSAYGRAPSEWDRSVYADVVARLSADGARVIAFDLLFVEPTPQDTLVAEALAAARQGDARTRFVVPLAGAGTMSTNCASGLRAITFPSVLRPVEVIAESADYLAYVNAVIDNDGVIRRQASFVCDEETPVPSFSLAAYLAYLRIPPSAVGQIVTETDNRLFVANRPILIMDDLGLWQQDFGRRGATFPTYSFVDVAQGSVAADAFADKIVLIGLMSSQGAPDSYPVPVSTNGQPMPGVEIFANAIDTLFRGQQLYTQSPVSTILMIVLLTFGSTFLYANFRWVGKVALGIILFAGFFVAASLNFSLRGEVLDLFDGGLAVLVPGVLSIGFEIRAERRARETAEALFESVDGQRRLLDAIFMRSPLAIVLMNSGFQIIRSNKRFETLFSAGGTDLIARLVSSGLKAEDVPDVRSALADPTTPDIKMTLEAGTYILQSASIHESDFRVVALSDVSSIEQVTALKTRLIRIAAHDVRNPLSSILGFVELMQLHVENLTERQQEMLRRIKTSGETINTIMGNLLKLEQLRSAVLPLEPINVKTLLEQIAESHLPDMERRGHQFLQHIESGLPQIMAEPIQLGQAISNLLGNAAKYTPNGGQITLSAGLTLNRKLRIAVKDTGYGIPPEAQMHLFTEFYRVRTGAAADVEGTGLGLSLVRTIIEAHKGRVWVESEEGKGSVFFIELPILDGTTPAQHRG